jgi:hypothetical protein
MISALLATVPPGGGITIPQPPFDAVMPKTAETIFNIFIFIPLGIALALAVRKIVKGQGPVLLYCIIGGALAATMEPVVDVLGLVYMKEVGAGGVFTVLDRTMPLYICFVYPWYVGGLGYLASRLFKRGVTAKDLFALWALDFVVDIFLESPGILAGTYLYYGKQPFNIWGFPLWWGFVNPVMPMITGALIYKLSPKLNNGWKMLAIIPMVPMADGIANGAAAWPMWATLNQQDVSYVVTYLAGFACLGLSLFCVWIIGLAVARPADQVPPTSIFGKLKALAGPMPEEAPKAAAATVSA